MWSVYQLNNIISKNEHSEKLIKNINKNEIFTFLFIKHLFLFNLHKHWTGYCKIILQKWQHIYILSEAYTNCTKWFQNWRILGNKFLKKDKNYKFRFLVIRCLFWFNMHKFWKDKCRNICQSIFIYKMYLKLTIITQYYTKKLTIVRN